MRGYGYHYGPCPGPGSAGGGKSGGGGTAALVIVLAVVVVAVASAGPVVRVVTDMVEIALAAVGMFLIAGGAVAALVIRAHRRERRELAATLEARRVGTARVVPVRPSRRPAIAPRRADMPALPRADASTHLRADVAPRVVTGRVIRRRDERR